MDECARVISRVVRDSGEVLYTDSCEFVYISSDNVGKDDNRRADSRDLVRFRAELLRGRDREVHVKNCGGVRYGEDQECGVVCPRPCHQYTRSGAPPGDSVTPLNIRVGYGFTPTHQEILSITHA